MNKNTKLLLLVLFVAPLAACTTTIGPNGIRFHKVEQPGFLEALVDIATDELTGDTESMSAEDLQEEWLHCQQAGDDLETAQQRYEHCAARRTRLAEQAAPN